MRGEVPATVCMAMLQACNIQSGASQMPNSDSLQSVLSMGAALLEGESWATDEHKELGDELQSNADDRRHLSF